MTLLEKDISDLTPTQFVYYVAWCMLDAGRGRVYLSDLIEGNIDNLSERKIKAIHKAYDKMCQKIYDKCNPED